MPTGPDAAPVRSRTERGDARLRARQRLAGLLAIQHRASDARGINPGHSREGGNPRLPPGAVKRTPWVPAFAGTTHRASLGRRLRGDDMRREPVPPTRASSRLTPPRCPARGQRPRGINPGHSRRRESTPVIPAKAGIQAAGSAFRARKRRRNAPEGYPPGAVKRTPWVPAFAGTTHRASLVAAFAGRPRFAARGRHMRRGPVPPTRAGSWLTPPRCPRP